MTNTWHIFSLGQSLFKFSMRANQIKRFWFTLDMFVKIYLGHKWLRIMLVYHRRFRLYQSTWHWQSSWYNYIYHGIQKEFFMIASYQWVCYDAFWRNVYEIVHVLFFISITRRMENEFWDIYGRWCKIILISNIIFILFLSS